MSATTNLPALIPQRGGVVGFCASVSRGADWVLPRQLRVAAAFGNVELNLTRGQIGAGASEILAVAVLGNIEMTVPAGIRVECDVNPVLGAFDLLGVSATPVPPDAPILRVTGSAILGCITVKTAGTEDT
jgi:Cell wall-active antibiotics response 4TMS YvqF